MPAVPQREIQDLSRGELEAWCAAAGEPRYRLTLCISSQAGWGMGCGFCATARRGLVRTLSPAEIVGQVRAGRALAAPRPLTNIVFMGMGEPLANYEAVRTALDILTAEWGYAISPRRITVSTVGLVPVIRRLIAETRVNLAVSLSATTDAQRARLVRFQAILRDHGVHATIRESRGQDIQAACGQLAAARAAA